MKKLHIIKDLNKKIIPLLETVTEERERATEFTANIRYDLDPMNE